MSIEVKNLVKVYGEQKAVNDISFSVNKGEIVGFLGPNGAGKSTTMKILTGYLQATQGDAFVCGINVKEKVMQTKSKIGYLPESNPLYYDMYIREYLGFIAAVHKLSNKKAAVDRVIDLVGLTPESKKKIGQLSKGYKQRVGLGAALIHDPEVLILDEPTTGLDPNQIGEIRAVIQQEGKDKTVLFSSHILQEVEAVCNRVIIINKGLLVANDTVSNLQAGNKETHHIIVQFGSAVSPGLLSTISGVDELVALSDAQFQLTTRNPESMRRQLMELALQQHLNIVSMHSETKSLEAVFKTLTSQAQEVNKIQK